MEATSAATTEAKSRRIPNPQRFGYERDAAEAGRRGGQASGISRRMRKERKWWEAVYERSSNGMALRDGARREAQFNRDLDRARIEQDSFVHELTLQADALEQTIADLRVEVDELRGEFGRLVNGRHALHRREQALKATLAASEPELIDRLKALDAAGGLDVVLAATGVLEPVPDDEPS